MLSRGPGSRLNREQRKQFLQSSRDEFVFCKGGNVLLKNLKEFTTSLVFLEEQNRVDNIHTTSKSWLIHSEVVEKYDAETAERILSSAPTYWCNVKGKLYGIPEYKSQTQRSATTTLNTKETRQTQADVAECPKAKRPRIGIGMNPRVLQM